MTTNEDSISSIVEKMNKIRQKYQKLMTRETNLKKKTEYKYIIQAIDNYLTIPSDIGFADKVLEDVYILHMNELIQVLNKKLKKR